jgi:hypothetical protein
MQIKFSDSKDRWRVDCHDGVVALVEGATSMRDAHSSVMMVASIAEGHTARLGLGALLTGEVCAAIYGNVIFIRQRE